MEGLRVEIGTRKLAVIVVALVVALALAAGAESRDARVLAFAQDGAAYAWVTAPCTAHVRTSPSAQTVVTPYGPYQCVSDQAKLVLSRGRLLWLDEQPAIHYDTVVYEWTPGQPPHMLDGAEQDDVTLRGNYVSAISAGGGTAAYAVVDVEATNCTLYTCDNRVTGGHLTALDTTRRMLPVAVAAALISVAGQRIALVPAPDDATLSTFHPTHTSASVEVRSTRTGELLWRDDTTQPVAELAASTRVVAALLRTSTQSSSIVVYDAATGRLLRTVTVAASASDLGASGDRIVYRTDKQIRLLRHPNPVAVASGNPVGLSISGNRIGWVDATGIRFARVP
jgi:hypothetical protein